MLFILGVTLGEVEAADTTDGTFRRVEIPEDRRTKFDRNGLWVSTLHFAPLHRILRATDVRALIACSRCSLDGWYSPWSLSVRSRAPPGLGRLPALHVTGS